MIVRVLTTAPGPILIKPCENDDITGREHVPQHSGFCLLW